MSVSVREQVNLQPLNTLAVPSVAEYFHVLQDPSDCQEILDWAASRGLNLTVLGEGSNVVLGSSLEGLVLQQQCEGIDLVDEDEDSVTLRVAAGENWHDFVNYCVARGYHGLENLALIPGTVGAAPVQNIGAYGVEIGEFLESVEYRELDSGSAHRLSARECEFAYRDSVFKKELRDRVLIEAVTLRLPRRFQPRLDYPSLSRWLEQSGASTPTPRELFDAVVALRSERLPDPHRVPNAGSFFKNPQVDAAHMESLLVDNADMPYFPDTARPGGYRIAAAWLIERCGFKQLDGEVRVHPEHALVLINPNQRDGAALREFAAAIVAAVKDRFGLTLEQEPRNYG